MSTLRPAVDYASRMATRGTLSTRVTESGKAALEKLGDPAASRFGEHMRPENAEILRAFLTEGLRNPDLCKRVQDRLVWMRLQDKVPRRRRGTRNAEVA
jgi:hypothetical protein